MRIVGQRPDDGGAGGLARAQSLRDQPSRGDEYGSAARVGQWRRGPHSRTRVAIPGDRCRRRSPGRRTRCPAGGLRPARGGHRPPHTRVHTRGGTPTRRTARRAAVAMCHLGSAAPRHHAGSPRRAANTRRAPGRERAAAPGHSCRRRCALSASAARPVVPANGKRRGPGDPRPRAGQRPGRRRPPVAVRARSYRAARARLRIRRLCAGLRRPRPRLARRTRQRADRRRHRGTSGRGVDDRAPTVPASIFDEVFGVCAASRIGQSPSQAAELPQAV